MGEPAENRKEMKVVLRQAGKTGDIMEPGKGKGAAHPGVWLKSPTVMRIKNSSRVSICCGCLDENAPHRLIYFNS